MESASVFHDDLLLRHHVKPVARLATVAALPAYAATATTLTATANGVLPNIDGVAPAGGNVILAILPGVTSRAHTGLFVVADVGLADPGGRPWILRRHRHADTNRRIVTGMEVYVSEGTALQRTLWRCPTTGTITMGTTNLDWVLESSRTGVRAPPARELHWQFWQKAQGASTTMIAVGSLANLGTTGTAANYRAANGDGSFIGYTTTGVGTTAGWMDVGAYRQVNEEPRYTFVFMLPSEITGMRIWVGASNVDPTGSDDPAAPSAMMRYSTSAGDTSFMIGSNDGAGGGTYVASGIVPAANTRYVVEIEPLNLGLAWAYWINGSFAGLATSNLPSVTAILGYVLRVTELAGATKQIRIAKIMSEAR